MNCVALRLMRKILHTFALIGLTVMVAFHAYTLDVTNDEAYSFFLLKTEYYRALFGTANTHWLNSILMKIEMLTLGDAPFAWRLHSVLAFPFFCVGVYRVTGFTRNNALAIICYSLIVLNPYVLDWFALARGYALALTFQVWVLYYLIRVTSYELRVPKRSGKGHFKKDKLKNTSVSRLFSQLVTRNSLTRNSSLFYVWAKILLLCALMLVANLSYFYTFLGIFSVFLLSTRKTILQIVTEKRTERFTKSFYILTRSEIIILALGFVLLLFLAMANLWFVRQNDPSMYGGNELVYSIFGTVWEAFFYQMNDGGIAVVLAWLTLASLLIFGGISAARFIKNRQITLAFSLTLIVGVLVLLNLFFHILFDAPYLANRTALQWWIPGVLLVFFRTDDFSRREANDPTAKVVGTGETYKVFRNLMGLGVSAILAIHLYTQFNPNIAYEWRDASYSKRITNDLHELKAKNVGLNKYVIGVFSNYYKITDERFEDLQYQHLPEKKLKDCEEKEWGKLSNLDYIIVSFDETIDCLQRRNIGYEIVRQYDNHRVVRLGTRNPQPATR